MEFLRANYAVGDHETFVANVLHGLPKLMASDLTAYCEIDPIARTSANWLDRPEVNTPDGARIWENHMMEMPVLRHYVTTHDGRALRVSDLVTNRQFRQTGVYYEHYRPKDVEHLLATWLPPREVAIGIGVHRNKRDYSERDKQVLELLRPHLAQGWRNAHAVSGLRRRASVARSLAALHPDTAILDPAGQLVFLGGVARQRLAAVGAKARGGALPDDISLWARRVAAQLHGVEVPVRIDPMVIERSDRKVLLRPYVRGFGVLLIVEDHRPYSPARAKMLGLTPREDEVLHWVIEGKTNADIAAILQVGKKTIEKHLEHVYLKLDVPNRAAAVTAALTVKPTNLE